MLRGLVCTFCMRTGCKNSRRFLTVATFGIHNSSGSRGARGPCPPGPVKISHKKDGRRRRPHRFPVSRPPLPGRWIRYCIMSRKYAVFVAIFVRKTLKAKIELNHFSSSLQEILIIRMTFSCFSSSLRNPESLVIPINPIRCQA